MSEEKHNKVVTGKVTREKQTFLKTLQETFLAEDIREVRHKIGKDVILPAIKKTIYDAITNGLGILLGYSGKSSSDKRVPGANVSYRDYYQHRGEEPYRARTYYSISNMIFDVKEDAQDVLKDMKNILKSQRNGRVSYVSYADFLELCGYEEDIKFTDNKYGWTDLSGVEVIETAPGEWQIDLPRVEALD